ncbi:hypothetical protein SAMN05428984_2026 [Sphingomonas sp. OK281]|nr:hypothetical protein SAMN05428984_2026 [Sphingomonas sp. OK281]
MGICRQTCRESWPLWVPASVGMSDSWCKGAIANLFYREGGSPVWAPAFAGEQSGGGEIAGTAFADGADAFSEVVGLLQPGLFGEFVIGL